MDMEATMHEYVQLRQREIDLYGLIAHPVAGISRTAS